MSGRSRERPVGGGRGLRVCLVTYEFPPEAGGEASYAQNLSSGLSDLGHEVTLVLPDKAGVEYRPDPRVRVLRVRASRSPLLKVGSFVLAVNRLLPRLVKERGIDVVHFAFDYPSFPPRARGVGAPVVATVHHLHAAESLEMVRTGALSPSTLLSVCRGMLLSLVEVNFARRAAQTVAVSRFTQRSLRALGGMPEERTRVVHNGVGVDDVLSARDGGGARRRHRLGEGPLLLFVGRVGPSKGLEPLLGAFAKVARSAPGVRLVVAGGGDEGYAEELKRRAGSLGVRESVTFTGRVSRSELCELYAASTAFVLPSLMEGFGISLVEAMAAGKPCIATSVGAVPEVVQNGKTGVLVPPAAPKELAEAILKVLSSPELGAMMGRAGRESALKDFTVERMSRDTAAVYLEASGGRFTLPRLNSNAER